MSSSPARTARRQSQRQYIRIAHALGTTLDKATQEKTIEPKEKQKSSRHRRKNHTCVVK